LASEPLHLLDRTRRRRAHRRTDSGGDRRYRPHYRGLDGATRHLKMPDALDSHGTPRTPRRQRFPLVLPLHLDQLGGSHVVAGLLAFAFGVWNLYRQGKTGSTIGKSTLKFKVVSERTGEPIGFPMSIARQIAHIVDSAICYIGYLLPLWHQKRQTVADMIMSTVCLPIDAKAMRTH
jgi:RDD family